jgi:acyl homoserine lactone synthase
LRKEVFIDKMDWPLYQYDAIEFEQYDTFNAVYIIAHEGAHVVGGVRLIRTDHEIGTGKIKYSYMIRDAYNGHLPGMPTDICFEKPPTDQKIWELTRLATLPGADVARDLLHAANHFLAKSMGFVPARLGPTVRNEDGAFLAFSCDVVDFSRKQDFDYVDLGAEST